MARDEMQDVELADGDAATGAGSGGPEGDGGTGPAEAAADATRRRRVRRVLRWGAPVAALALVGAIGTQAVLDHREDRRVAAAREVEGVVRYDVGPELPVHVEGREPAWAEPVVDGVRVVVDPATAGVAREVRGVDDRTDAELWRTPVESPAEAAATASQDAPWCTPGAPDAPEVRCLVVDRPVVEPDATGAWAQGAPVRTRLLTLDTRTGAVTADRSLGRSARVLTVDDDVVLARIDDGVVTVSVEDLRTGTPRWSTRLPGDARVLAGVGEVGSVWVTDAHVGVQVGQQAWAVARADGAPQAAGPSIMLGRQDRLVGQSEEGAAVLLGRDGTGDRLASGWPVQLAVDDGSEPGLELLGATGADGRTIRAVDAATGTQAWERELPGEVESSLLLLDGVLYGADAQDVWALDVADGRERWRTPRRTGVEPAVGAQAGDWYTPLTDGRQLMLVETLDGAPVLRAWSLRTGERLWTTPLPREADGWVGVRDGALYGAADPVVRLGG